ncbi:MAG: hypothetical protein KGL53_00460 [Elusimicrobia bacterium]|nr:hypothetical protein [Elusimicrobiota bacterium]
MSGGLGRELGRKAFHMLSLVYLGFYLRFGRGRALEALAAWALVVWAVERTRLSRPELNASLLRLFRGIHRPEEAQRISGILWTTLGCWLTIAALGAGPRYVEAALLMQAFGDATAALAGKAFGRRVFRFRGKTKSLEGTLACLAVCLACARGAGFAWGPALAAASAASAVELAAPPPDDNLWLPLTASLVLALLA